MDPVVGPIEIVMFVLIAFVIPTLIILSDNKAAH